MDRFLLHSRLAADTVVIGQLPLCRVLLMKNALFPWVILVPAQADLRELTDLSSQNRAVLMEEIASVMQVMQQLYQPAKMNMAALGNMVPQLHVHLVARYETDKAWPDPVWGKGSEPYTETMLAEISGRLRQGLAQVNDFQPA